MSALVTAEQPLTSISQFRYKAKDSRRFFKLMQAVGPDLKHYHEQRQRFFKDWAGEPNDKGEQAIKEEHMAEFMTAMKDLLELEIAVEAEPIPFEVIENEDVSPMELAQLGPFIQYAD